MKQSVLFALLAVLAFIAANIPFFNHHVLGIFPRPEGRKKHLYCRLLELLFLYGVTGAVGLWMEQKLGQRHPQGWEFYAASAALFLALAFPGFIYRYLWRRD